MDALILVETRAGAPPLRHRFAAPRVRIGRALGNDLVLEDARMSRRHLEIRAEGDRWIVEDLGSRHGTSINGRPLIGRERLRPGDELLVGACVLRVDSSATAASPDVHARETSDEPPVAAGSAPGPPLLVGSSPVMRSVRERIALLASSDVTILVRGEPGTGKELAARLVHALAPRAAGPFVVVNCPAVTPSLFEAELFGVEDRTASEVGARPGKLRLAHGGTVFFDEIGDLSGDCQAKLLRFLQTREVDVVGSRSPKPVVVDVRVVLATNKSLEADVRAGRFRRDLYDRITAAEVLLPPLCDRRADVPELVAHFLACIAPPPAGITDAALGELRRRAHPGNVRGLEGVVRTAAALARGGVIDLQHLDPERHHEAIDDVERLRLELLAPDADFEAIFAGPFRRREIERSAGRALFARLLAEFGRKADLARALGLEPHWLMNYLRDNRLNPE